MSDAMTFAMSDAMPDADQMLDASVMPHTGEAADLPDLSAMPDADDAAAAPDLSAVSDARQFR